MTATNIWNALPHGWTVAFDQAWASFLADSFGIGAVLTDPADDSIIAVGRNRVAQRTPELRTLSGNMAAHAEMNAFASLDRFNADGLHLYTTLEPCLMCAASAMLLKVAHVHFAARDEFFIGMEDLWAQHPLTSDRQPMSTGPFEGLLANFARLLPMVFTLANLPGRKAATLARDHHPRLAGVADRLIAGDSTFEDVKHGGSVVDALTYLEPDLDF